jgi:hypothetical protein
MISQSNSHRGAVMCIFCGLKNLLPESTKQDRSSRVLAGPPPSLSIVRCYGCGKEAIYLAGEVIKLKEPSGAASSAE